MKTIDEHIESSAKRRRNMASCRRRLVSFTDAIAQDYPALMHTSPMAFDYFNSNGIIPRTNSDSSNCGPLERLA